MRRRKRETDRESVQMTVARGEHMRHAGRTGVTKGSCLIFFEEQSESTTMFIPINLEGSDSRGSPGVSGSLPASPLPGEAGREG